MSYIPTLQGIARGSDPYSPRLVVFEYYFRGKVLRTLLRSDLGFGFTSIDIINYRDVLRDKVLLIMLNTGLVLVISV